MCSIVKTRKSISYNNWSSGSNENPVRMKKQHLYIVTESQLCNNKEDPEHCIPKRAKKDKMWSEELKRLNIITKI